MRYKISFDRMVNQLVPYYLNGRNLILFIQASLKPLQVDNDEFSEYASETRIETSVTSQKFYFEWFLNRKFGKYFLNSGNRIAINPTRGNGTPVYYKADGVAKTDNLCLYQKGESGETAKFTYEGESMGRDTCSFIVSSPKIDTSKITEAQYLGMLKYYIEKYRLSGKTYTINFYE